MKTILVKDEPWFVAKNVATILEIKNISDAVKDFDKYEKGSFKVSTNGGIQNMLFVSEQGLMILVAKAKKKTAEFKINFLNALHIKHSYITDTKESLFAESIIDFVQEAYKLHIQTQFYILGYKIDFYLPEIKLAIEFDEEHHKYCEEDDLTREHLISKALDCSFLRIPHQLSLSLQLALVTKTINQIIYSS